MSASPVEIHVPVVYAGQNAMDLLLQRNSLTQEQIETCFTNGSVWLETAGKPFRIYTHDKPLKRGHKIHLYCNLSTLAACPFQAQLVQDFETFSVWNKPSGMLSQGSKWGDHWTLSRWVYHTVFPERESFITHRLDRFTSGLMIVAHNKETNAQFHRLFEQRQIIKTYRAIAKGLMTAGECKKIDSPIAEQSAITHIRVLDQDPHSGLSLVELKPETGRKHQIRIHLAELGFPVLNDRQYGCAPFNGDLQLQSSELIFNHPQSKEQLHIVLQADKLLTLNATGESS